MQHIVLATERTLDSPNTDSNFPFFPPHPRGLSLHTASLSQLRDSHCHKGTFQSEVFFLLRIMCPMQWLRVQVLMSGTSWVQILSLPIISLFPCGSDGKESACSAGDAGSVPGLGRAPGEGNDYLLHYSCLENSMNRGTWQATFHGITKSWIWLSD